MTANETSAELNLTLEESIQRLKGEILAHDWKINARRIRYLEAAFKTLCVSQGERKVQMALLTMATNTLAYIKKHQDDFLPLALDFLKEAMANTVMVLEEEGCDPARDEEVFQEIYKRFQLLKYKIRA